MFATKGQEAYATQNLLIAMLYAAKANGLGELPLVTAKNLKELLAPAPMEKLLQNLAKPSTPVIAQAGQVKSIQTKRTQT